MKYLKYAFITIGCILTNSSYAKEYLGFNLCGNTSIQAITTTAKKNSSENPLVVELTWNPKDILIRYEKYTVGDEAVVANFHIYKNKLVEISIYETSKIFDYVSAKYGNILKVESEYVNPLHSIKNYFFNVKDDSTLTLFSSTNYLLNQDKPNDPPSTFSYLAYQCTEPFKQLELDKAAAKNNSDTKKAIELGM